MAAKVAQLQPPVKGLNFRAPAISLDPQEALILDNILPKSTAGELRAGYVEHVVGIPGRVMTLLPFIGNLLEDSRVFACTEDGKIYDATFPIQNPQPVIDTGDTDGVWDFTNSQGGDANYLIMVSADGGYWTYSKDTGFVKQDLTGDAAGKRFSAVFNWKNRVWLIEENSTNAYYLDNGAVTGPGHKFNFGPVMNQGGYLSFGCDWTFNAGYDIDDYLVLTTTAGEVIVYKGSDPTDVSTFQLQGVWYIGRTPAGNKCFTQFGGEMYIMSSLGVVPVSKLVNGQVANDYQVASADVAPELHKVFKAYADSFGWEMDMIYNQNFVMLKTPQQVSGKHSYWVMNVQTGAWGTISAMPMNCSVQVLDQLYFGTTDGKVCRAFVGDTDGESIDGTPGRPIIGKYLGGFNDYDTPTNLKSWQLARPVFLSTDPPRVGASILTNYEAPMPSMSSGAGEGSSGGRFDVDSWNQCTWAGGSTTYSSWVGLTGLGYYGALAISFTGPAGTKYISTNVTLLPGGVM